MHLPSFPLRPCLRHAMSALAMASAALLGVAVVGPCPVAYAETIETFSLDGGGPQTLDDDTLAVTIQDLTLDAVTFDAVLTVVGSARLTQSSSGLGVSGGSNPLNDGEWLTFSLAVENVVGGSVTFDGFTGVDLTFFGTDGEQAVFSSDDELSTALDNFHTAEGAACDPVDLTGHLPTAFSLFGNDDGGTVSFRVDSIDAQFSAGAPVPEPITLLTMGAGVLLLGVRRRRGSQPE